MMLTRYVTTAHALDFANDLKLAHYVKIPPRQTFWAQVIATVVSAFVCTGVMNFQITSIPDLCSSYVFFPPPPFFFFSFFKKKRN